MAGPTITTSVLPPARIGFDYKLAAVTLQAVPAGATWLKTAGPAWLLVSADGKLSGIAPGPCGTDTFTFSATNGAGVSSVTLDLFRSAAPNGIDLVSRLTGVKPDSSIPDTCVIDQLNLVAAAALQLLTDLTEVPFSQTCVLPTYTDEVPWTRSYTARVGTAAWPVQELTAAILGTTPLAIGTLKQLLLGQAQIAIDQEGEGLRLHGAFRCDGLQPLFVSYTAGFVALPTDLYEAWAHLALLEYKESARLGITETHIERLNTKYTRKYPEPIQAILSRWRRSHLA